MFRSLSFNYKEVLSTQVQDSQGLLPVKKMDFFLMFWTAWTVSFAKENILQAFKSTGVWPMDLEPVLKKFPPLTTDNKEDPEFEQLEKVLCWKDLQRLFNKVVPDKSTKEAKTLSSSLHYLSTQFALILAENTGLRASLQGKKKHKVKGQVLSHLTNNSGSLTLSPATVEKALEALAQKDREAEEELARKARSKAARQAAKENKLALQAVAADKRKADKEKREKEKEERAQKIAQRKREREEARSIPAPPKKRKQASKPASNRPSKKQAIRQPGGGALGVGGGGVGSEATLVSPPKVTKSGRNISLPSKFR
ncbi:hypothetical protein EJ07DRAFT_95925 [Lizonia empirigonia]|nr:hypothetical protein EJ07DRAFT_95925 [Lizonia empirigonia]